MNVYRPFLWPLLRHTDPEWSHERALALLELAQRLAPGRALLRAVAGRVPERPVEVFGLRFPNLLGVAAGFDKDARVARGLGLLGFGHVEVGTLTPRSQPGNPRPRIVRLPADRAIINRMGFPNRGVEAAVVRLAELRALRQRGAPGGGVVVGVSLGKQKETPLERAADDYVAVLEAVYPYADYLAVNLSSPNTPGLRELQGEAYLEDLLARLETAGARRAAELGRPPLPLLVKIDPDLETSALEVLLEVVTRSGVAGIIATNTTLSREGLADPRRSEAGGLSGRPLAVRSTELIARIARRTAGRLPVVGVGGVATAADVRAKLAAGASLVQLYTGLVYEGPGMAGRLLRAVTT